jgi:hypothetical protein
MTEESLIREAHERFRATLREQPAEPATTTLHQPGCTRSGWAVEDSHSVSAVQIATCLRSTP